jgi:shikimate kinase
MNHHKRIFLVGHPGAGKGLVAKKLADKLGWRFIDADLGIEFKLGKTVREILGEEGAKNYLNCQSELLASLVSQEKIVVATDGSIVGSEKNCQILDSEFTVFLKVSTSAQLQRTSRDATPLLTGNINDFLDQLHRQRDENFEKISTLIIDTEENTVEDHISTIIKLISNNSEMNEENTARKLGAQDLTLFHKDLHSPVNLSKQQARCLKLLSQGKTSKEIAILLNISYRTVEGTLAKLMEVLGCSSSKELIILYHHKP